MTQTDEARYNKALEFASEKHKGQIRIGGEPYISHPVAVAQMVEKNGFGIEYRIAALFHDLLEDTDASESQIEAIGGKNVLDSVKLLTKKKGYVMSEYVAGIRKNDIARTVKAADRLHNLRCAVCAPDDFKRRYILESVDWYLSFSPEIPAAVKALAATLSSPVRTMELEYEPISADELFTNGEKTLNIDYRIAEKNDAQLLVDIYNAAFRNDYLKYGECPAYGKTVENMEASIAMFKKYIILCGGTPVGVISYENKGGGFYYIGCLCIIPEFQRKGIGTQAVAYLLSACEDWKRVALITPTDNEDNIRFYTDKAGFHADGKALDGNVNVTILVRDR